MTGKILAEIDAEIARMQQVRALLSSNATPLKTTAAPRPTRKRRKMRKAARKRIADAQKARWAKLKATKKG